MISEKTVDVLLNDGTTNIVDCEECKKLLSDYQNWYNANEGVTSLGEGLQDLIFMSKNTILANAGIQ